MVPQVGDVYLRGESLQKMTDEEQYVAASQDAVTQLLINEDASNIKWVFPSQIDDRSVVACPDTIIYTTEFDHFRKAAADMADVYGRNGKLLDYGILAGTYNEAAFVDWTLAKTDAWFHPIKRVCDKYLPQPLKRSILNNIVDKIFVEPLQNKQENLQ